MSPNDDHSASTADAAFSVIQGLRGLRQAEEVERPVLFNDLVRYVQGTPGIDAERIQRALDSDSKLRAQYHRLLGQMQRFGGGQLRAAASSDERTSRSGDGFRVSWIAQDDQVYVVVEFENVPDLPVDVPLTLHVHTETRSASCSFAALHDRKTQIIVRPDDKLLVLLANSKSRVSIM